MIACGGDDPPDPAEVRASLDDLAHVLREGQAAMAAADSLPTGAAFGFATLGLGGSSGEEGRLVGPLLERFIPADRTHRFTEGGDVDTDALVAELEQKLFTDANYLGNGVYRVPASLVCEQTIYDDITGAETTTIDPECAQQLDQAQLRVRVASEADALRFFIQVDANHDEPLSFLLSDTALAVSVNLDEASDAMAALAPVFGEPAPNADLAGQVTSSLTILGAAHARASVTFDSAISVKFADQGQSLDGPQAFRFSSAAGEVFGIELDANATKGKFDLGIGETSVHIPGDEFDPETMDVALGGASVNATFQGNTLTLANLSLGTKTTTVSVNGQQGLAIDLNANDGRKLDVTITTDPATGDETVAVTPRLDLQVSVNHAVLGDEPPVYDVTRVQMDGSLRGNELTGELEVLTGSVSVTTNPSQYGFSATAGQCVQATEIYDDITFTSYTEYSVGACQ